jgi:hypothetical protein
MLQAGATGIEEGKEGDKDYAYYLCSSLGCRCSSIVSVVMYDPLSCRFFHAVRLVVLFTGLYA